MKEGARPEEDKLAQAPIVVILGSKKHNITPLVIRDSRPWRAKLMDLVAGLPELVKVTMDDAEAFGSALKQIMVTMPDQVTDLFFEYAKDLNRDEIESIATEAEMSKAFEEVIKVAFPLAESLPKVMERLSQ